MGEEEVGGFRGRGRVGVTVVSKGYAFNSILTPPPPCNLSPHPGSRRRPDPDRHQDGPVASQAVGPLPRHA